MNKNGKVIIQQFSQTARRQRVGYGGIDEVVVNLATEKMRVKFNKKEIKFLKLKGSYSRLNKLRGNYESIQKLIFDEKYIEAELEIQ